MLRFPTNFEQAEKLKSEITLVLILTAFLLVHRSHKCLVFQILPFHFNFIICFAVLPLKIMQLKYNFQMTSISGLISTELQCFGQIYVLSANSAI